jgi:O6-methylguanine-DNA--protein-cysteine methyltransferase
MAADNPHDPGELLPRPDPTRLTTDQLRRELSALREILTARLDAMDVATRLLSETVNRTPTQIQTEITHVRELMQEKLGSLGGAADEKFRSIELQFAERDVRTTQAATASAQALAAALQAAKEAVFEQAQAAAKAAEKTELSFTKQIDQIQLQITTVAEGFGDRIAELKERIDRGEGSTSGASSQRTESRLNVGSIISVLLLAVAVLTFVVLYATKR